MATRISPEFSQVDARHLSVVQLMDSVLEGVIDFYAQEKISLPKKRYWAVGEVAADCEQFTATLIQTYLGVPGGEGLSPAPCYGPRTAVIGLQIMREVPTVGPTGRNVPEGSAIQEKSVGPAIDSWALMDALRQIDQSGNGLILTLNTVQPNGGLHGVVATVAVEIP